MAGTHQSILGDVMPAIVIGLIFMAIGAGLQAIIGFALLPAIFHPSGSIGTVLALIGLIAAGVFGFITGLAGIYALRPRSIWVFALDVTWSAINTVSGMFFLIYCAVKGSHETPDTRSQDRGAIWFSGAALPGAQATTIGTVMGGDWLTHETVHIQQARIFGPFYWPTYLMSYVLNMLSRFITGRFTDPHWQAYGRVLMEDWAYHAAPADEVEVAPSILWFFLTLLNAVALGVLIHPIPVIGVLPSDVGLAVIPWWIGLIVMLAYALIRSFLPKANEPAAAPPVFA
jgi:hypothetical protein